MKENGRRPCDLREKVTFGQEVRKLALRLSGVRKCQDPKPDVCWQNSKCAPVATALLRGRGLVGKDFREVAGVGLYSLYFYTEGNGKPLM